MNYFYIYNIEQANFFIKEGLSVVEVGIGKKKDVYIKFVRNYVSELVFTKWTNR